MSSYVSVSLRRAVALRAKGICEYCLIHQDDTYFGCEIEHIISEKHGGSSTRANLAWACADCNRAKGADIATITAGKLSRLFNPRTDRWNEHFRLKRHRIIGVTEIGRATVSLLDMNSPERVYERGYLALSGRYPPPEVLALVERR